MREATRVGQRRRALGPAAQRARRRRVRARAGAAGRRGAAGPEFLAAAARRSRLQSLVGADRAALAAAAQRSAERTVLHARRRECCSTGACSSASPRCPACRRWAASPASRSAARPAGRRSASRAGRPKPATSRCREVSFVTPGLLHAPSASRASAGGCSTSTTMARAPLAVVVSETLRAAVSSPARIRSASGSRQGSGRPGGPQAQAPPPNWLTIVGVVRDVKSARLEAIAAPLIYRSVWQISNLNLTLVVRTRTIRRCWPSRSAARCARSIRTSRCSACARWTRWSRRRWPSGASRCCCSRCSRRPRSRCRRSASTA